MHRILIAAFAALALALAAPTAASAQYQPPYFFPTADSTPHPPVAGLEDHEFTFGSHWATGTPLTEDFADYIAWGAIESDYRLRAGAHNHSVYYSESGLIGTTYSAPTDGGVDWQVRLVRYVPPAIGRLGHFCVYEGFVNGPVLTGGQNVFTQTSRTCDTYLLSVEGQ